MEKQAEREQAVKALRWVVQGVEGTALGGVVMLSVMGGINPRQMQMQYVWWQIICATVILGSELLMHRLEIPHRR